MPFVAFVCTVVFMRIACATLVAALMGAPISAQVTPPAAPPPQQQQPAPAAPQQPAPGAPPQPAPGVPPQQPAPGAPPPTTGPAPAPVVPAPTVPTAPLVARSFLAPAGMILNAVRPDRVVDFELVVGYLKAALEKSTNPRVQAQAQGWRILKATEPGPNGSVLYVFVMDPAVPGADYALGPILSDAYPDQIELIWKLYQGALAGGGSLLNLTPVMPPPLPPGGPPAPGTLPPPAPPGAAPAPTTPAPTTPGPTTPAPSAPAPSAPAPAPSAPAPSAPQAPSSTVP